MRTVTVKTKAWITSGSSISPKDLLEGKRVTGLVYTDHDMTSAGWTLVGDAEITVGIPDEQTLIDNKVAALREEVKSIRAEATAKVTHIEGQIQSLLAISCDAALVNE